MATVQVPDSIPYGVIGGPTSLLVDATSDIVSFISSQPNGTTVEFDPLREYRTDGVLDFTDQESLTIRLLGAVTRRTVSPAFDGQGLSKNPHWRFKRCDNVILEVPTIYGLNTVSDVGVGGAVGFGSYVASREFEHAVQFIGCDSPQLLGGFCDAVYGDGLSLLRTTGDLGVTTSNPWIQDYIIDRCGRQGVSFSGVDNATCLNVDILHGRRSGFDLEPANASQFTHGALIKNCSTNVLGTGISAGGRGEVNDVTIDGHTFNRKPNLLCSASDDTCRENWVVKNSIATTNYGSPQAQFRFAHVVNVEVSNVTLNIVKTQGRKAVQFANCQGALKVVYNTFKYALAPYVLLDDINFPPTGLVEEHDNILTD